MKNILRNVIFFATFVHQRAIIKPTTLKMDQETFFLKLTGDKDKDRPLIIFCGNCVRDEFEPLLREKYQALHKEHPKRIRESTGQNGWQKHINIMKSWKELEKSMPLRMVERILEKYPDLHITDTWICCLRYFNFECSEIDEILCCSQQSVYTRMSEIRRKLNISGDRKSVV